MSTTSIAITGMRTANSIIIETSNNIANSDTPGFKTNFTNLANIAGDNGVHGQQGTSIDVKGSLEYTGIVTDLSTSSNKGFFVVKNKLSDEVVNVVTGSFRPNVDGQLEYLEKYLLLGAKYNDDGSLPPYDFDTLQPIVIDNNIMSKAVPTTHITENFNLNSGLLAKGQGSFVVAPQTQSRSVTENLNGILQSHGDLQPGNGFSIQIQEEKNGQITSDTVRCIFGGSVASSEFTMDVNAIKANPADSIDITYNGVNTSIVAKDLAAVDNNDGEVIADVASRLRAMGLNATTVTSGNQIKILILPPNNSNDSFAISGALATSLGITCNILPVQKGSVRFSSMNDLKNQLQSYFKEIKSDSNSDSLIFIDRPNTNVSMANLQDADVLKTLGLYSGPVLGQGYDPYDQNSNMASGNTKPDIAQVVTLYDSKGGQHLANIALKKVEDGWIQEFYLNNPDQVFTARTDGLLQVSKLRFDTKGNLTGGAAVVPTITTSQVSDPYAPLASVGGKHGSFTVNGVAFNQGTDFTSMVDLVNVINSNPEIGAGVEATIFEDAQRNYRLQIISKGGTKPGVSSDVLGVDDIQQLPDASQPLTITFNKNENIDPLVINFDYNKLNESVHKEMSGGVFADGTGVSTLRDISIGTDGILVGVFANGTNRNLYKIPLATYANVTGLNVIGDNALRASGKSGHMQIVDAGNSGTGSILSASIEGSNVEQAEQLTKLVTNKQLYNMNTKSWKVGNEIIDTLLSATT